jgi:DNA-binding transcriptional LysR family regulator
LDSPYSKYEYSRPRSPRSCRLFNADAASQCYQGSCGVKSSPTTVSRCVARLRKQFRDVLFVRTRSGMEPTSIALAAAPAVDDIVHVYATQLSDPGKFDPKVSRREFALAASDVGHLLVLPRLFSEMASEAPRVKFTAVPLSQCPLIEELQSGEVDLAVGGFPNLFAGVLEQTLYQEEYVCLVCKDHPTSVR